MIIDIAHLQKPTYPYSIYTPYKPLHKPTQINSTKMKMTNPFINLLAKLREEKQKNIERQINDSVYVSNDPNDPDNGIYVFCNGVPVSKVTNTKEVEGCYVSINDVGDMLKDIKKMYRNHLNGKPIKLE